MFTQLISRLSGPNGPSQLDAVSNKSGVYAEGGRTQLDSSSRSNRRGSNILAAGCYNLIE